MRYLVREELEKRNAHYVSLPSAKAPALKTQIKNNSRNISHLKQSAFQIS
jgi:hypothetical protein|tara:strand:+ start:9019 stop:9168 length:150 start_codon:yes stop_codon:yes gene_type:complete